MKERKPWLVAVLGICTLFVYSIIWWYKTQRDVKEEAAAGIMGIGHLMIMLVPVVNIVYYIYWICTIDNRLSFLGATKGNRWFVYLLLSLIGMGAIFVFPMIQAKINTIGTAEARGKTTADARTNKYAKYLNTNDKKKRV